MKYTAIFTWIGGTCQGRSLKGAEEEIEVEVEPGDSARSLLWKELHRRDLPARNFARITSIVEARDTVSSMKVAS